MGHNAIVSQLIQHDTQDIMCNKCHNAICRESLVTCLICTRTVNKTVHGNLIQQIFLTRK